MLARKVAVEILKQNNTYGEKPRLSSAQDTAWKLYEGSFTPAYDEDVKAINDNTLVNSDSLRFNFTTDADSTTTVGTECYIKVGYENANYDVTFYYERNPLPFEGGEVRHLTFADTVFGPEFPPLARVLKKYKLSPVVICESDGTQADDALYMKHLYESL